MKILNPRLHGYLDYSTALVLALSPSLFGFDGMPQILCYVLAAALVLTSLFTAYPLGAVKIVPFPVHGSIEAVIAPLLAFSPWLLGFSDAGVARNFFLIVAVALAALWLVTDYRAAERPNWTTRRRSHA